MKKIKATATESFEENVTKNIKLDFVRISTSSNTTISGTIVKDDAKIGSCTYDKSTDVVTTQLKPFSTLTADEFSSLYTAIAACLADLSADEEE